MIKRLVACVAVPALLFSALVSAQIALYPSGPAEDSAFIRFINATPAVLEVNAEGGQAPLRLESGNPVSAFIPVQASNPVKGSLSGGGEKLALQLKVEPGEFASVFVLPDGAKALKQVVVHDVPDDFNGLKASLGFFNLDGACHEASLRPAGRTGDLFKAVAEGSLQRRSINPVSLSVQLVCANANVGTALSLGELKAGQRYSVLVLPGATGPQLLFATDALSH
jgi:hypothetical protein